MSRFLAELRRLLKNELGEERAPRRSADASGGVFTQTVTTTVDQVAAAGNASGAVFARSGLVLSLSPASSAGAVLEVCFDAPGGTSTDRWVRMVPCSRARRPDGRAFGEFRVRRAPGTPASALLTAVFDIDPDEAGVSVEHQGRFPQLSGLGSLTTILRALDLAGNEVDLRASDEGALAVAAWDGAAYSRLRTVTPADALAQSAGTLDTLARLAGYNGATWDRLRAATPADALAAQLGLAVLAQLQGYNGATFDRLRSVTPADNLAASAGALDVCSRTMLFDGTNWDRRGNEASGASTQKNALTCLAQGTTLSSIANPADALSNSTGSLATRGLNALYNGSTWDRWRSGAGVVGTGSARVVEAVAATSPSGNVAVGASSAQVVAALATRKSVTLYNAGPDNVWIGIGEAATTGSGAGFLIPPGNSYTSEADDAINAIRDGAAATLYWIEERHG